MLDSKEIRLGNLFLGYNNLDFKWSLGDFVLLEKGVEIDEIIKSPIPISDDWLIRFGYFIVNFNGIEASMPNKRYTIKSIKDYDGWFFCDGDTVLTNLEFIHTLQNLWFLLTNQELELKT